MSYLMYICFDNSALLPRDVYYLEYAGVRFKLIQNRSYRWSDVLLTITEGMDSIQEATAYARASELLSAYTWKSNGIATLWPSGGFGIAADTTLRTERCRNWEPHQISLIGHYMHGSDIQDIPLIENENQRRALILFRQAQSTDNKFLQFLFLWEILAVGGNDPIGWVNKTFKKRRAQLGINDYLLEMLPLKGKSLGNYFDDDCRDAIAHIGRRKAGKTTIEVESFHDLNRVAVSARVLRKFAKAYIKDDLRLSQKMYLVRPIKGGFPVFRPESELRKRGYKLAYSVPRSSTGTSRARSLKWDRRIL